MCIRGSLIFMRGPKPRMGILVDGRLVAVEAYCGERLRFPDIDVIYKCPIGAADMDMVPFIVRPPVPQVPKVAVPAYLLGEVHDWAFVYVYDPRLLVTRRGIEMFQARIDKDNCVVVS